MSFLALIPSLLAGTVYVNGVRADVLPEITMKDVTVRVDQNGDVWVDAPGYRVQVVSAAPCGETDQPTPAPPANGSGYLVPVGRWWLVTEDNESVGQGVEVLVNGVLIRRVVSGHDPAILDLAPWLRSGTNTIVMNPIPCGTPGGGALNVYLGLGTNQGGTVRLENPQVVYSRRASDIEGARQFTLFVPS